MRTIFLTVIVAALAAMSAQAALAQRSTGERHAAPAAPKPALKAMSARRAASPTAWPGASILIVDEIGAFAFAELKTGAVRPLGRITGPDGEVILFSDITFCPSGKLYGITFGSLFEIAREPLAERLIANYGPIGLNALACDRRGRLWAHSDHTARGLVRLFVDSERRDERGGTSRSDGDLVFHEDELLVSTIDGDLVSLTRKDGAVLRTVPVGPPRLPNLFGLVSIGPDELIGCAETTIYRINAKTGNPTPLFDYTQPPSSSDLAACQGTAYNGNFRLNSAIENGGS